MSVILDERSLEQELQDCSEKLEYLQDSVSDTVLLNRLKRERPLHPTLLLWRFMTAATGLLTLATLATLALPILSTQVAQQIAILEGQFGYSLPLLLTIHGVSALMMALGARQLASLRGASSPPLPHELSKQTQLFGDIIRLKTVMEVRKRTARTATPAPTRQRIA